MRSDKAIRCGMIIVLGVIKQLVPTYFHINMTYIRFLLYDLYLYLCFQILCLSVKVATGKHQRDSKNCD